MAAASLVQGCVGAVDVVSTLAVMTFLFFTANKSVTLHLYSYCLHSEQSGMEHYYFLHLPSSVYGFLEKQISYFPLFLLFPSLFLHLLLWFLYMTLLFHCVLSILLSLFCPSAPFFLIFLFLLYFCLLILSVVSHCAYMNISGNFPSHRPI